VKKSLNRGVRVFFAAAVLAAAVDGTAAVRVEFSLAYVRKTPSAVVAGTEGISPYPIDLSGLAGAAPLTVDPSFLSLAAGLRLSLY
jgi:hypothetical protein